MSVWVTLVLSLLATGGLFFGAWFAIQVFFGITRKRAQPKIKLFGAGSGNLGVVVSWSGSAYDIQFYRIQISFYSPFHKEREGKFTVTFDAPVKQSFAQVISLPPSLRELISHSDAAKALVSISAKSVQEFIVETVLPLTKFEKILKSEAPEFGPGVVRLEMKEVDEPTVLSLDFEELQERKARLSKLIAQALAKEAAAKKAAEAKAAKPAAATPTPAAAT